MVALLERGDELAALAETVDAALGGRGSLVTVEAPAGIGKTRLLEAAATFAEQRDMAVLSARGSELDQADAFAVARQLFVAALRGRTAGERDALLSGGAAGAASLLLGEATVQAGAAVVHGLFWLAASLADERPHLLLVDDAHLIDPGSLELLSFLAPRVGDMAVALVVAARPPEQSGVDPVAQIEQQVEARRLRPQALSLPGVTTLLRKRRTKGSGVSKAFAAACHEVTGGNPFYLRELAAELDVEGITPNDASAERVRGLGPAAISRTTLVRMTRLSPDAVSVARALAVLGDGAELRHLSALTGLEPKSCAAGLGALTRAALVADERPPRFRHPIVRSSILSDLTATELAGEHGRAAAVLHAGGAPAERVAAHLLEAEPGGVGNWAAQVMRDAAAVARDRGAAAVAVRHLRRALEEPELDDRDALMVALGVAEFESGQPEALDHLRAAMIAAVTPVQRARAALAAAVPLVAAGHGREAITTLESALAGLDGGDDDLVTELEAELSGVALLEPTKTARVMRALERTAAAQGPTTAARRRLLANLAQWSAMTGAPADRAAALASAALGRGALLQTAGPAAPAVHSAVFVLIAADRFADADAELDRALVESRQRGSPVGFMLASMMRSLSAYRQGDLAAAVAEARAAADTANAQGWGTGVPVVTGFLVDALIERGDLDEARTVLAASGCDEGDVPDQLLGHALLVARGRLRLAMGETRAGVADLLELGRRAEKENWSGTAGTPTYRTYAAPAVAALGESIHARELAAQELDLARAWGAPRAIGMALRVAGVVTVGDERLDLLTQAVAQLRASPAQLELARALVDLGAALRREGRATDARDPLREGADLAARCGARPLEALALEELAATGARRRSRVQLSGVDALTPSERRIAAMAAEGMSNTEIARALFLHRKTIEMHLGSSYRKLGIGSRGELAAALMHEPAGAT